MEKVLYLMADSMSWNKLLSEMERAMINFQLALLTTDDKKDLENVRSKLAFVCALYSTKEMMEKTGKPVNEIIKEHERIKNAEKVMNFNKLEGQN